MAPTLDITRWATNPTPRQVDEQGSSLTDLFGSRNAETGAWYLQNAWLRTAVASPDRGETILRHDEVTLKEISLTSGRVVIALSDEQAEQAKRIAEGR